MSLILKGIIMSTITEESMIFEVMAIESGIPYLKLVNMPLTMCGSIHDKDDRGGKTSIWGWTETTLKSIGINTPAEELTLQEAYSLYAKYFFIKSGASKILLLHPHLARAMLNFGVHAHYSTAAKELQKVLNFHNNKQELWPDLKVDGLIGGKTLSALSIYLQKRKGDGDDIIMTDYLVRVGRHYQNIIEEDETQEKYMMGWSRRVHYLFRDYFKDEFKVH